MVILRGHCSNEENFYCLLAWKWVSRVVWDTDHSFKYCSCRKWEIKWTVDRCTETWLLGTAQECSLHVNFSTSRFYFRCASIWTPCKLESVARGEYIQIAAGLPLGFARKSKNLSGLLCWFWGLFFVFFLLFFHSRQLHRRMRSGSCNIDQTVFLATLFMATSWSSG